MAMFPSPKEVEEAREISRLRGIIDEVSRVVSYDIDAFGDEGLAEYIHISCETCRGEKSFAPTVTSFAPTVASFAPTVAHIGRQTHA